MNNERKKEMEFYRDIREAVENDMNSNFAAAGRNDIKFFWGIGELRRNLLDFVDTYPECSCVSDYAKSAHPLFLDIFALITDGSSFKILILEIKKRKTCGLSEWSQLLCYCLVAKAAYGLLVNIDGCESPNLADLICNDNYMSNLCVLANGETRFHMLGCMHWKSLTQNLEYSNLGHVKSLAQLSGMIMKDFT